MIMTTKVGRNAPCPCGSGLKYKKCCLPKDEAVRIGEAPAQAAAAPASKPSGSESLYIAVPESLEEMNAAVDRIAWPQPQYGSLAAELVPHLAGRYSWDEINATILIWFAYAREHAPIVQKPGVFFAALEYSLAMLTGRQNMTKAEVAKRYEVSAGSVSKRIGELAPFVERAIAALNDEQ
ncbi:YecA family protein [Paenibacillus lycopersici]|nr:SEC-C domain-containing protein [Paenibacillus lycopersici]